MQGSWRSVTVEERSEADADAGPTFGHFSPNALQRGLIALARATVLRRGVFRGPLTRAILALGAGKLDIRFRGAAFRIRGESNLIEYGLLLVPTYNGTDIDFLLENAPPDATFVDLGCNIGLYSRPLAVARPRGRVVSVDANPKMISRIRWNTKATGLANLIAVHAAVSDIAGHEDRALVPLLDTCPPAHLPRHIVIEHPEPQADDPGCTAPYSRRGDRLIGRTRNTSLYQLA